MNDTITRQKYLELRTKVYTIRDKLNELSENQKELKTEEKDNILINNEIIKEEENNNIITNINDIISEINNTIIPILDQNI